MRDVTNYLRRNPQVLVLLVICLVLGVGTFVAVMIALITASPGTNTGDPSGSILALHLALATLHSASASLG